MGRPISFISEDVTLRVASGGVLTVSGALVNDGKIVVEPGGLLVVREMSSIFPYHMDRSNCGGISSAGMIVVEKNGRIIGGGTNGIYLTGGVVYNYGVIASENFTAAKKQLINNQSGAWAIAGRSFGYYDVKRMIEGTYKYFTVGERGGYITDYSRGLAYRSCNLPYAKVNVASGAVYGKTSRFNNYGSYGEAGQMVKVFYHDGASAAEVLSAPSGTLGYQRSATSHTVTRREVVYASGQIDTLRSQYDQMQNMKQNLPGKTNREVSLIVDTGLTFEKYVEQYFRSQGINLDEKVTVWDGVITVNGLPALTVPWNQLFSAAMKVNGGTMYYVKRQCPAELGDKAISLGSW